MAFTVDAHTAHHLYHNCLKGDLMQGRTLILVSHHVQLCAAGASYIVSLDNGRLSFSGSYEDFKASGVMAGLVQSEQIDDDDDKAKDQTHEEKLIDDLSSKPSSSSSSTKDPSDDVSTSPDSETESTLAASTVTATSETKALEKKAPRKLIEEEKRAVGRIGKDIWIAYFSAVGSAIYWVMFILSILLASASPVAENGWLR